MDLEVFIHVRYEHSIIPKFVMKGSRKALKKPFCMKIRGGIPHHVIHTYSNQKEIFLNLFMRIILYDH